MHARPPTADFFSRVLPAQMQAALRRAQTFRLPRIFGSFGPTPPATPFGIRHMADLLASRLRRSLLPLTADYCLAALRSRRPAGTKPVHSMAAHLIIGWFAWTRMGTSCGIMISAAMVGTCWAESIKLPTAALSFQEVRSRP